MSAQRPAAPLTDRLRYAFDNSLSRGTTAMIAWLGVATGSFLLLATLVIWATGLAPQDSEPMSFADTLWFGLMRTLDSGTVSGDVGTWVFRGASLAITLGGIFLASVLIGVLTSGIEGRLEELRKGRSRVIEADHTVILGWTPQVFTLVSELVEANANQKDACIVILGEVDKVEMEDAVRDRLGDTRTTRVVCRSGSSTDPADLAMVGVTTARSILIPSPDGEDPDAHVIKSILAITNAPDRRSEPYHLVAVIKDPANMEAARLVGRSEAEIVLAGDMIARVTAQTCRQNGLSVVYTELLDFGGDEIYFKDEPSFAGRTFGDILSAYETSSVMGIRRKDGAILLNPPMDLRIEAGDKVVAIAQDDDAIRLSGQTPAIEADAIVTSTPAAPQPERTLVLGWNWRTPRIVTGLDAYVPPGSAVTIVSPRDPAEIEAACEGLANQALTVLPGNTTERRLLETLDVGRFDHIIIVCDDEMEPQRADSRVLVTLLHLRDMGEKMQQDLSIVSEMLDVRNRQLAEVTQVDDFIVSERLVSLLMTQVSQNKELARVFEDLFDPAGSEIYLKPATDYVVPGRAVSFHTVVEAARRRGEVAIGYKLHALARDAERAYGVRVNPPKGDKVTLSAVDRVIVLAES